MTRYGKTPASAQHAHERFPTTVCLFHERDGSLTAWDRSADAIAAIAGISEIERAGDHQVRLRPAQIEYALGKLIAAGHKVSIWDYRQ